MPSAVPPSSVRFPPDLRERVAALAAERGVSFQKVVIELVRLGLGSDGDALRSAARPIVAAPQPPSMPPEALPALPPVSAAPAKAIRTRTSMCVHRLKPEQHCKRCDV
jgi:hypothetical protein